MVLLPAGWYDGRIWYKLRKLFVRNKEVIWTVKIKRIIGNMSLMENESSFMIEN